MIFVVGYQRFICVTAKQAVIHYYVWRLYYFMQTIEVTFQKNYHTSNEDRFLMETIIIRKSVDIGEDTQQVIDKAREEIEINHRRNNPHLFPPDIPGITNKDRRAIEELKKAGEDFYEKYTPPHSTSQSMEDQINSCKDLKVLDTYRLIVKGKPELETIYQSKLKELQ